MLQRYSNRRQLRLISEINTTVIVDLVLVLLFVFVLTASVMRPEPALALRAPSLQPAGVSAPERSVRLFLYKDSSVALEDRRLARADLSAAVRDLLKIKPGTGVEVRAHRDLSVQQLSEVMTLLSEAGVKKTAFVTHADEN